MSRTAALLLALALALGGATRAYNIAAPFGYGFDGWLGGMYGQAARNFARHGLIEMRLAPVMEGGPLAWGDVAPHLHHPPLVPVIFGLAVRALGVSEWALRLPSTIATLASIALVFAIGRRVANEPAGAWAALAFAALPMTAIYGGLVNFEPIVLALTLATWLAYLRWRERGGAGAFALLAAAFAVTILADWYGAYVGPALAAHCWLARPGAAGRGPGPRARRWAVPALALVALATVAGVFLYYEAIWPGAMQELARMAKHRASAVRHDYTQETFTAGEWVRAIAFYLDYHFRKEGLLLGALGLLGAALSGRADLGRGAGHAAALALVGLQNLVVFPQNSFQHAFLSYPLAAPLALAIGLFADWLLDASARWSAPRRELRAALAAVLFLFGWSAQTTGWRTLALSLDDRAYRDLGRAIAEATPFEYAVATPGKEHGVWVPAGFYADRVIVLGIDSEEKLEAARRDPPRKRAPVRFVVFTPALYREHEAFARALVARYPHAKDDRLLVVDVGRPPS